MKAIIHYYKGGCLLGYRDTDENGKPLTLKIAQRIADYHNHAAKENQRDESFVVRRVPLK